MSTSKGGKKPIIYKTKRDQRFEKINLSLAREKKQKQNKKKDTKWRATSCCDGREATDKCKIT